MDAYLENLFDLLAGLRPALAALWLGLAVFTVAAVVLMRSRWGQSRPLQKCAVLSLLAHLLLVGYTMTVRISTPGGPGPNAEQTIEVSLVDDVPAESPSEVKNVEPPQPVEETPVEEEPVEFEPLPELLVVEPPLPQAEEFAASGQPVVEAELTPLLNPSETPTVKRPQHISEPMIAPARPPYGNSAAADPSPSVDVLSRVGLPTAIPQRRVDQSPSHKIPDVYRMRVAPDRSKLARRFGANAATEKAVAAALKWLAENQSPDGRWKAAEHGAGSERVVAGRDRRGAGAQADSAITGLALLAFLASGNTHQRGSYRENVERGLEYLLAVQKDNGSLAGEASTFAAMYSHAMAAFAISEAYGISGDQRLRDPVRRAIAYTIAAQDPRGGGFRYKPGDAGDTSQLGWQLMAIKSAELADIPIPWKTQRGVKRFLQSVSSGRHGGLASYRPDEAVSHAMTAEAMVCWQFLGVPRDHPSVVEGGDYLLEKLPDAKKPNLYYWYYATLGMHQLQGEHWEKWNAALQKALVENQRTDAQLAGSWDPSTQWGGYGGRVYSTALATLCLEVYYRYLPLYVGTSK